MKRTYRAAALAFAVLFAPLLLCSCFSRKSNIPDPADSFYVYDEANVIDEKTEEYIIGKNADLYKKCGGQIVVACVKTTGSTDIKDYALSMFNKWGVGSSKNNNGVLVLLSIEEDDYWCLQGKGLEDLLQSGTIKLLLNDDLEPYFAKKQYADGVRALFDALVEKFEQIYGISVTQLPSGSVGSYTPEPEDTEPAKNSFSFWNVITTVSGIIVAFTVIVIVLIIVISVAITVFIIIASVFSAGSGGSTYRASYKGININPHTFRPTGSYRPGGFRFGGFSGGSHHSGGGFSFGGGSHRGGFSGGSHHGGFSGGSHHSGGGGFSRGGGAGRR